MDVGSLQSIYRRRSTKPYIEDASDMFELVKVTDHLKVILEDPGEVPCDLEGMIYCNCFINFK